MLGGLWPLQIFVCPGQTELAKVCDRLPTQIFVHPEIVEISLNRKLDYSKRFFSDLAVASLRRPSDGGSISRVGMPQSIDQIFFACNPYLACQHVTCRAGLSFSEAWGYQVVRGLFCPRQSKIC